MNPAMIILIILACIAIWFLLSCIYKPLGKFFYRIGKDAVDEMTNEEDKEKEE